MRFKFSVILLPVEQKEMYLQDTFYCVFHISSTLCQFHDELQEICKMCNLEKTARLSCLFFGEKVKN